ncbi:MAG: type I-MYXAN CRISPR-associated protein Cas6/Cmx6 [Betaproteobacteria bacterium]|nr:type I-MYXAN CRISPR-associated protein Cas6/Cmx6 [Betaproteobacteria bacterium]
MRLFSPEWEAIKEFDTQAQVREAQFDLAGRQLPADHGLVLHEALCARLPWLADTPGAGVHPIQGEDNGAGALVIGRRTKLTLRLPIQRMADAAALCGARFDLGNGPITVGALKERPLMPCAYLYSHFVDLGMADEVEFLAEARRHLDAMALPGGLIPGKQRKMRVPRGEIVGYSLMLHDISLAQSITLQEQGLGGYRGLGCGLFIPHKSIKEVIAG